MLDKRCYSLASWLQWTFEHPRQISMYRIGPSSKMNVPAWLQNSPRNGNENENDSENKDKNKNNSLGSNSQNARNKIAN